MFIFRDWDGTVLEVVRGNHAGRSRGQSETTLELALRYSTPSFNLRSIYNVSVVRLAKAPSPNSDRVKSIAVCAGSGSDSTNNLDNAHCNRLVRLVESTFR